MSAAGPAAPAAPVEAAAAAAAMEAPPPVAAEAGQVIRECVKLANNIPSKKNSKESRRGEGSDQNLKFLNNLHNADDKLQALSKKYSDCADENKRYQTLSKQWEKKYIMMQREKDQTQLEYNKTILVKSKLESLCRELQKQIKSVKDESMSKIKEEEERRKETLSLFQNTISELTAAVQHNNEKNTKLRDDNLDMTEKFKSVMEQYELREHQVDKISKQMALEAQLSEAKLAKANLEAQAEKEKLLAEKRQLLVDLTQYQARCNDLQSTEVALRSQIAMYTDKYDEFQNALKKSNEVFGGFKGEMEKMSKKVEKQEKEALSWKQRWEKSHAALIDMAADKQHTDSSFALQSRQLAQLQRLCRTMQAERTVLLNTLRDNNIERPPLTQLPPEPKTTNEAGVDRVDVMAANCAQLKQSLCQLQGRLNDLTSKKSLDPPEQSKLVEKTPLPQKKQKKGKNKKGKLNKEMNIPLPNDSENTEPEETTAESDGDSMKLLDMLSSCPFGDNLVKPTAEENGTVNKDESDEDSANNIEVNGVETKDSDVSPSPVNGDVVPNEPTDLPPAAPVKDAPLNNTVIKNKLPNGGKNTNQLNNKLK